MIARALGVSGSSAAAARLSQEKSGIAQRGGVPEYQANSLRVTISAEGIEKLLKENLVVSTDEQNTRSTRNASSETQDINDVRVLTYTEDRELVGINEESDGVNGIYYSATGRPVTAASQEYFNSLKDGVRAGRIAIFEREYHSGASASAIYDKLQAYMESQPTEYLDMICWRPDSDPRATSRAELE